MLLVDGDPADSALGVRLADVAEVVAVLAHSDGWAQVLAAGPALESFNQLLGDHVNCLLNHLDDMLKKPSSLRTKNKANENALLIFPNPSPTRIARDRPIALSPDIKFRRRSIKDTGFKAITDSRSLKLFCPVYNCMTV